MYSLVTPKGYESKLSVRETEKAIKFVKDAFQRNFVKNFGFERVSAPLFVKSKTGVNDDLNGVERAVRFDVLQQDVEAEIVHSLAKWKRLALKRYGFRNVKSPAGSVYSRRKTARACSYYYRVVHISPVVRGVRTSRFFIKKIIAQR